MVARGVIDRKWHRYATSSFSRFSGVPGLEIKYRESEIGI